MEYRWKDELIDRGSRAFLEPEPAKEIKKKGPKEPRVRPFFRGKKGIGSSTLVST